MEIEVKPITKSRITMDPEWELDAYELRVRGTATHVFVFLKDVDEADIQSSARWHFALFRVVSGDGKNKKLTFDFAPMKFHEFFESDRAFSWEIVGNKPMSGLDPNSVRNLLRTHNFKIDGAGPSVFDFRKNLQIVAA